VVRPPVGEKEREGEHIGEKNREEHFYLQPEVRVVNRAPDCGHLNLKNQNRHDDGKYSIGKLV